jgi:hypothetical protein
VRQVKLDDVKYLPQVDDLGFEPWFFSLFYAVNTDPTKTHVAEHSTSMHEALGSSPSTGVFPRPLYISWISLFIF